MGAVSFPTTQFDPLAGPGGAVVPAVLRFGGTIDLMPENSVNVNVGGVYTPSWAQGLRMSLDYTKIDFENRIVPGIDLLALLGTDVVASNPDVFVRDENGQLQVVDFAPVNVAERLTETIDGDISYQFDTSWGAFTSGVNVHYVIKQTDTLDEGSDPVSLVGQRSGVDRYRLQGRLNWEYDNIGVNLIVDHTPAYDNPPLLQSPNSLDLPTQRIDSRTTVDLTASYVFDNGLTLRAGARNLLNADFPFGVFSGGRSFDETRIDVRGRVAFFEASYDFSGLFNRN